MSLTIRSDPEAYLQALLAYLAAQRDVPLEEMDAFFARRTEEYEAHMAPWAAAYVAVAAQVPQGCARLLDLGCGTGLELDQLFRRLPDLHVTGVDCCAAMLDVLRQKHSGRHLQLVQADYFTVDLGTEAFDAAVSVQSLHHFPPARKRALYARILRALRPGGVFLLCDYVACCEEEEALLAAECRRKRAAAGIPDERFVHFDTPLTLSHETALLREAAFLPVETLDCFAGAALILAHRPG